MKKKLILIAAMALSALSYSAATDSVVNVTVTAELVAAADVIATNGASTALTITYSQSDITSIGSQSTTFDPIEIELQAYVGADAALSVDKNITLTDATAGTVNAVANLSSKSGDLQHSDDGATIKLSGILTGATSLADFELDIPNFGIQKPLSGTYTAKIPVSAYYN